MCYDDNAAPPNPPGPAGAAEGEDLVLTAADGNQFAAYIARPATVGLGQVIIYPDVRGLHQFYKDLALRFAEIGIAAIALDYFGRTAGVTPRDESFEFWAHVADVRVETFFQDVEAALAYLRTSHASTQSAVFPIGFCMGGSLSFISGTNPAFGFAGVIGFYAGVTRDFGGAGTILDYADKIGCPLLGLFGGADESIPATALETLKEKLPKNGQDHTIVTYPGAPHSFFDRKAEQYAEFSADAWQKILNFMVEHIPQTS